MNKRVEVSELASQDSHDLPHSARRMLQALDAYWLHCDGLPKGRYPRGRYDMEDWWGRFEKYRALVEGQSKGST